MGERWWHFPPTDRLSQQALGQNAAPRTPQHMRVWDIDVGEIDGGYVGPDWMNVWFRQLRERHARQLQEQHAQWVHCILLQRAHAEFKENVQQTVQGWQHPMVNLDIFDCDEADEEDEQASRVVPVDRFMCTADEARVILEQLQHGPLGEGRVQIIMGEDTTYSKATRKLDIDGNCTSYAVDLYDAERNTRTDLPAGVQELVDIEHATAPGRQLTYMGCWQTRDGTVSTTHWDEYHNVVLVLRGVKTFYTMDHDEGLSCGLREGTLRNIAEVNMSHAIPLGVPAAHLPAGRTRGQTAKRRTLPEELPGFTEHVLHAGDTLTIKATDWHYVAADANTVMLSFWFA